MTCRSRVCGRHRLRHQPLETGVCGRASSCSLCSSPAQCCGGSVLWWCGGVVIGGGVVWLGVVVVW